MTIEELKELDIKTIDLLIKDSERTHEETSRIGQPYTTEHFRALTCRMEYLKKIKANAIKVGAR